METLFVSAGVVAVAEIGDKTMLLALVLAARFRAPVAIIAGIFVATVFNHALAALVGVSVAGLLEGEWLRWIVGGSFLAMAAWTLVPDRDDGLDGAPRRRLGPFLATAVAFFLVEMGDKTQIATVVLAARYDSVALVTAGTTLGMLAANAPAVLLGGAMAARLPLGAIRAAAAAIFAVLGVLTLVLPETVGA